MIGPFLYRNLHSSIYEVCVYIVSLPAQIQSQKIKMYVQLLPYTRFWWTDDGAENQINACQFCHMWLFNLVSAQNCCVPMSNNQSVKFVINDKPNIVNTQFFSLKTGSPVNQPAKHEQSKFHVFVIVASFKKNYQFNTSLFCVNLFFHTW